ncbi:unnamed protein product [Paramecium pentaurelia]|uniref:Uncharacterized protein n=1 Tax=Paramecium pentaurelia TaxID=43138 RepID=A0A8S1U8P7_9CILI|nr:unnamed protein product [Paramecium pentaurelia]
MQIQIPKDVVKLQYDFQNLLNKYHGLEQLYIKQSNEILQLKKLNENLRCNVENYECQKCKKYQNQIEQIREETKQKTSTIVNLENQLKEYQYKNDEFQAKSQIELQNRITYFEDQNKEVLERLDRVTKDNQLFDILLRERDQRIESLSEIIEQQELQIQQDAENDNAWKEKFIKINKDYHKLLQEYNSTKADLEALYVSQRR